MSISLAVISLAAVLALPLTSPPVTPPPTAAALHVDASIPNFIIQEFFPFRDPSFYELVTDAYDTKAVDSYIDLPSKPGLGVELNDEVMARYDCTVVR